MKKFVVLVGVALTTLPVFAQKIPYVILDSSLPRGVTSVTGAWIKSMGNNAVKETTTGYALTGLKVSKTAVSTFPSAIVRSAAEQNQLRLTQLAQFHASLANKTLNLPSIKQAQAANPEYFSPLHRVSLFNLIDRGWQYEAWEALKYRDLYRERYAEYTHRSQETLQTLQDLIKPVSDQAAHPNQIVVSAKDADRYLEKITILKNRNRLYCIENFHTMPYNFANMDEALNYLQKHFKAVRQQTVNPVVEEPDFLKTDQEIRQLKEEWLPSVLGKKLP